MYRNFIKYFSTTALSVVLLSFSFYTQAGFLGFGDNKPSEKELVFSLAREVPGHVDLDDFEIQASQNIGNEVDPIYASRFKATAALSIDLYVTERREDNITFAVL